jgi:hypothetical protein
MIALLARWKTFAAAGLGLVLAALFGLWRIEASRAARFEQQAQAARTADRTDQARAAASQVAEAVVDQGAGRDARALNLHEENSHAIQTAPGFGQGLDPELNAAGRRSLCQYDEYAGSAECLQLRGADPGRRPQTGGAGGPAAP